MVSKYTLIINDYDATNLVERDSYSTSLNPVKSDKITTMDGVDHCTVIRYKGSLEVKLNPQDQDTVTALCTALMTQPCQVQYYNIQKGTLVTSTMMIDNIPSADFLSRCLANGLKWHQLDKLKLTEM